MTGPKPGETIANGHEAIGSHEGFYIDADILKDPIFCGDDRNREGVQLFGGVINVAYNQAVVEEANQPGSVQDSLQERVEATTAALVEAGAHPGVHSDTKTEGGEHMKDDKTDSVGCAYANLRAAVSRQIAELGDDLVEEVVEKLPELFRTPEDRAFAVAVVAAHGRLAKREGFQAPGRALVLGAASKGAKTAVLEGEHVASDGLYNTRPDSKFDSGSAAAQGLPAYNHDAWAAEATAELLEDKSDPNQRQIANAIDAFGTMYALGVEAIMVRR